MSIRRLIQSKSASSAAEFGLVLPLLILFLFGIIDAGRFIWEYNRAEKATQAGARVAVVTTVIPSGLITYKYVGQTVGGVAYLQGDLLSTTALGKVTCTRPVATLACTCDNTNGFCPPLGTASTAGFDAIVTRMNAMYPPITASNVVVEYSGSGIGYAGDPSGMDISPLVSVKLTGMTFAPLFLFGGVSFSLPTFLTALTAEDSSGTQSN